MVARSAGNTAAGVAFAVGWIVAVAGLGSLASDVGAWYAGLEKPSFTPPNWVFGPVWSLIYILTAAAFIPAWRAAAAARARRGLMLAYAVNGVLNVLWSFLFFTLQRPSLALVEIVPLWLSIVVMIALVRPLSRLSAWLLAPYLVWVTFATALNAGIVWLN